MKARSKLQCQIAEVMPAGLFDWAWLTSRAFELLYKPEAPALLNQAVNVTLQSHLGASASAHELAAAIFQWEKAWVLALHEATRWHRNIGYSTTLGVDLAKALKP
jgi:hypothetical protein